MSANKPQIFIFCNGCSHEWHNATAISEDGHFLAGHICSDHAWIPHDMGITSDWKHDAYKAKYPDGYELVMVPKEEIKTHAGITAAYQKHLEMAADKTEAK